MKANTKQTKDFDTVKTFREIKEKISTDIVDMTFEQLQAYLKSRKIKASK